jgi:pSer/pThr/pTyr-binding forkhead associated (FHA) protein
VKKRPAPAAAPYGHLVSVRRDGSDGDAHPLMDDQVDLGRSEGTLLFEDRFLAARHARIERRAGGGVALVPLDATNGVYVRLRAGETYPLVDGDHVLVGKEVLRFEVVEPEERALSVAIQHGVRIFGSPIRSPWGRLRQIAQTGMSRDIYHLVPPQVVLGREEGDLRFADDEFMSRRHARLSNRDGRFEVADLESSNGTFVRVRGERVLRPRDVVRIGDQLLRFEPSS